MFISSRYFWSVRIFVWADVCSCSCVIFRIIRLDRIPNAILIMEIMITAQIVTIVGI